MDINKVYLVMALIWIYSLAYSHDSDTTTIIDKNGEITICTVLENGTIVCL